MTVLTNTWANQFPFLTPCTISELSESKLNSPRSMHQYLRTKCIAPKPHHTAFNKRGRVVSHSINVWKRFNVLTDGLSEKNKYCCFILVQTGILEVDGQDTTCNVMSSHLTGIDMSLRKKKNKGNSTFPSGSKNRQHDPVDPPTTVYHPVTFYYRCRISLSQPYRRHQSLSWVQGHVWNARTCVRQ